MSKAQDLLDLQALDRTLDQLNKRLAEVKAALHETNELINARRAAQQAEQATAHDRATRKDLELAVAAVESKIKQDEQRLYSGLVKNPKELVDLQNEVAALKRQKTSLDDRLLEAMLTLEESEETLQHAKAECDRIEAEWRASQSNLLTEQAQLEADLAQQSAAVAGARVKLTATDLTLYDQLRRRKGGLAVVELEDGVCNGCGIEVTANVLRQLNQGDPVARCGNCERIVVRV